MSNIVIQGLEFNDNKIVLRGFGEKTGDWIEYKFIGGKAAFMVD